MEEKYNTDIIKMRKLGKRGLWLPAIFNILILIAFGAIVLFFFWWLLFSGNKESLSEIEDSKNIVNQDMALISLLRTPIIKDFKYTGSDADKISIISSELSSKGADFADAIELGHTDQENKAHYKQIVTQQVDFLLKKQYSTGNYGFIVDCPNEIIDDYMAGFLKLSTKVSETTIPMQDGSVVAVRLVTQ